MSILGDFHFTTFCFSLPTQILLPTSKNSSTTMLAGTKYPIRATSPLSSQSGSLTETTFDTGYEPKICVGVSGEHTAINFPSRDNVFNQEVDLTNPIANTEDFDHFLQQTEDSCSHYSAATTVPALLNLGSLSSTGELVRDDEFVSSSFSSTEKLVRSNDQVANIEEELSSVEESEVWTV